MLYIVRSNVTEPFIESNYEKHEELNATAFHLNFVVYKSINEHAYDLIEANSIIEDEDGHQYRVKQINENQFSKQITANHIFYDLVGTFKEGSFTGQRSFNEYANFVLNGTGWTFANLNISYLRSFNSFGANNVIQLLQRLIDGFDCEIQILPNRVLRFATRIGGDYDTQYRYKSNIKELTQSIDATNVRTRIKAYGADGISVTYTSPLANNELFGLIDAEPVKDESINNSSALLEFARRSLMDYPDTNIDVSVLDVNAYIGDTVYVIHEGLNINITTRVLSKTTRREFEESIIQLGTLKRRTIEDAIVDQRQSIKENAEIAEKAVDDLEEKTDRELAVLTVGQDNIRLEVTNVENSLRSEIVQTASSIRLQVEEVDRSVASLEITADRIQSNVTNLENNTQSSITQLSNNINLKVDVGGTISDINLSPGNATINADRIDLNGAVFVDGTISGNTDIIVGNNAAIGNALYFGGSRSSFDFIEVSGGDMTFNSFGDFMFSGGNIYINGRRVLTEDDLP